MEKSSEFVRKPPPIWASAIHAAVILLLLLALGFPGVRGDVFKGALGVLLLVASVDYLMRNWRDPRLRMTPSQIKHSFAAGAPRSRTSADRLEIAAILAIAFAFPFISWP